MEGGGENKFFQSCSISISSLEIMELHTYARTFHYFGVTISSLVEIGNYNIRQQWSSKSYFSYLCYVNDKILWRLFGLPLQIWCYLGFRLFRDTVTTDRNFSLAKCCTFKPLNAELNPICNLLALLGAHHILHVIRIRVKCWRWGSLHKNISLKTWTYFHVLLFNLIFTVLTIYSPYVLRTKL